MFFVCSDKVITYTGSNKGFSDPFYFSYLTKEIDAENKEGYFIIYKRLVTRISDMIKAIDADYPYASSLASTILEGSLHQYFLRDHFPSLTDCHAKNAPTAYFLNLVFSILKPQVK